MSLRCQSQRLIPRITIERFQEWVYQTDHPVEALIIDNYFLSAGDRLVAGDVIEAYATGFACTQYLRLHVVNSGRDSVIVAPFIPAYDIGNARVHSAPLGSDKRGRSRHESKLALCRLPDGKYRIVDRTGAVVVGGIGDHALGTEIFGKIRAGKLSVAEARRCVEKSEYDALQHT